MPRLGRPAVGFLLVAVAMFAVSCGRPAPTKMDPISLDELTPERIWERLYQEQHYTDYPYFPDRQGVHPGQSPHGLFHEIFINPTLAAALETGSSAPVGSIIVKKNYSLEMEPGNLTVMAKVEGYDPANNDWYWAVYGPDGTVRAGGSLGGCISCHEGQRSNDFMIVYDWAAP